MNKKELAAFIFKQLKEQTQEGFDKEENREILESNDYTCVKLDFLYWNLEFLAANILRKLKSKQNP
jgi:hypothetical protein